MLHASCRSCAEVDCYVYTGLLQTIYQLHVYHQTLVWTIFLFIADI